MVFVPSELCVTVTVPDDIPSVSPTTLGLLCQKLELLTPEALDPFILVAHGQVLVWSHDDQPFFMATR